MDKRKILKEVLGSFYASNEELLFYCPYCKHHKKKLSINLEKSAYKCWVCDIYGKNIRRLVKKFGTFKHLQEWDKFSGKEDVSKFDDIFQRYQGSEYKQRISLPEEFITLTGKEATICSKKARNFLKNRGLTKEDIVRWKIGYCVRGIYAERVIVPSFDEEGYINYFVSRTYNGDWRKYLNPSLSKDIIFNHLYIDWDSDIILVEGAFDAVVAGPNAIPLLGSTLREESKLFQEIVRNDSSIFIALDKDAEKKSKKIISKLLSYGIEIYKIDTSGFDDVGTMTKEEFAVKKHEAINIKNDDYLLYEMMEM
tara:strand:+ start:138 stop:1067 length:930 start_codon:yes stop_codon:yes gene_type:complete